MVMLQVLCLHLKRFRFTSFLRSKVDVYVEFPLKGLDISPYVNQVQCRIELMYHFYITFSLLKHRV